MWFGVFARVLQQEDEYPCYGVKKPPSKFPSLPNSQLLGPKSISFWKCKRTRAAHCFTDTYTCIFRLFKRDVWGAFQEQDREVYPSNHTLQDCKGCWPHFVTAALHHQGSWAQTLMFFNIKNTLTFDWNISLQSHAAIPLRFRLASRELHLLISELHFVL